MKKQFAVLLLTAVLLFTCSCSKTKPSANVAKNSNDIQETVATLPSTELVQETEPEYLHISEMISEDGSLTDEWGNTCEYSYHVPQLDTDTMDAEYINACIQSAYVELVASCKESIAQSIMPDIHSITWEQFQNGNVVSLVVKSVSYYGYYESYDVYNYDVDQGKQLLAEDLLALKNITSETYFDAVRRAAVQYFDEAFFNAFTDLGAEYQADYSERRSWTCSDQNIRNNTTPYLNGNGELEVITSVGSLAGADSYYYVLTPEFAPDNSLALHDEYQDAFFATMQDGQLQIGFSTDAEALLAANGYEGEVPAGETFLVYGLYSDYTDLCCGVIGENQEPIVFLLSDTGAVEFVDVSLGLKSEYFCSSGLIMGVKDIIAFEKGTTVHSVDTSGTKTDLAPLVKAFEHSISIRLLGEWAANVSLPTEDGGSNTVSCFITLSSENRVTMQRIDAQTNETYTYEGYYLLQGMSESGSVFCYDFTNEFGSTVFESAAALYSTFSEGDNGYNYLLHWRELGKSGAFSTITEEVILAQSVG